MNPMVSIVITTRNRRDELATALESCLAQDYKPLEVLVFDDASTDGTLEFVREKYPPVRVFRTEARQGLIVLRNWGFRESRGEMVFSLDDDAYYTDKNTLSLTVEVFKADPTVGAVALPFIEPRKPLRSGASDAPAPGSEVRSYRGCAHAVLRNAALKAGGYREFFIHQGEERDLCVRMLQHGYRVVYGAGSPVVHLVSDTRDQERINVFGVRNTLLFDSLNIPHPYMVPRWLLDAARLFAYKLSLRNLPSRLGYVLRGLGSCVRHAADRHPVAREVYLRYRSLPGHGPIPAPSTPCPSPLMQAQDSAGPKGA